MQSTAVASSGGVKKMFLLFFYFKTFKKADFVVAHSMSHMSCQPRSLSQTLFGKHWRGTDNFVMLTVV